MSDVMERVERGAAWLDEHEPGWELKIDLGELNLKDCHRCVLGQMFGNYSTGLSRDHEVSLDPSHFGFDRLSPEAGTSGMETIEEVVARVDRQYVSLRETWTSLIKERLDRGIQI